MEGRQALIALRGVLFLLGYCEQMDFIPVCPNQRWHLFFMLDDFRATETTQTKPFKMISQKSNQEKDYAIQDLLMTHFSLILLNQESIMEEFFRKIVRSYKLTAQTAKLALCHHTKYTFGINIIKHQGKQLAGSYCQQGKPWSEQTT